MNDHSPIAPSSAHIWAPTEGCPGWAQMSRLYPDTEESEAAMEGTAAHELAAMMVKSACRGRANFPGREVTVGMTASNGTVITDEIYDGALEHATFCEKIMTQTRVFGGGNIGIEQRLEAPMIHPDMFGTVDFLVRAKDTRELFITDLKFGYRVVDAFENWQLICYAMMALHHFGIAEEYDTTVHLTIVQPRNYQDDTINTWTTTVEELQPFFEQIILGAHRALTDGAEVHSGPHCRYCTARHDCPAAVTAGLQLYEATTEAVPEEMDVPAMARAYTIFRRASAHITAMIIAYEEQLKAAARSGKSIPGYRAEQKMGRKEWNTDYEKILQLGEMFGVDLRQRKAVTPTQAEASGIPGDVLQSYSERHPRAVALVPDDGRKARKVFGS